MRCLSLLFVSLLSGCASSWADIGGTIGGEDFSHPRTVFHGGDFIVIADRGLSCQQMGWVADSFYDGDSPSPTTDFVALLLDSADGFSAEVPQVELGFNGIRAWGLVNLGGEFEAHHVREGTLYVEKSDDNAIEGSLSANFAHEGVGGDFATEYCQTLSNAAY